jgi:hypothetical protein
MDILKVCCHYVCHCLHVTKLFSNSVYVFQQRYFMNGAIDTPKHVGVFSLLSFAIVDFKLVL